MMEQSKRPRILFYDIEATSLKANFGFIICIGYKWLDEKACHVIAIDDFPKSFRKDRTDDSRVLLEFAKVVAEADWVVYQYGQFFDEPFINTRLLIHNLPPMPPTKFIDTWRIAKEKLKLHSNRLETMIETFDIAEKKTPLNGPIWTHAGAGYPDAIRHVVKHCRQDVLSLELVYLKIRTLAGKWHPYLPLVTGEQYGCQFCGSKKIVAWGKSFGKQSVRQRHYCKECKSFFLGAIVQRYKLPVLEEHAHERG